MSNKEIRERKEMDNLLKDPKYSRQVWKNVGLAVLMNPAKRPIEITDKDGNPTANSSIENYGYKQLKQDFSTLGQVDREPTELEMILQCQIIKARTDTGAAIFVRDTLGAKPVDESKVEAQLSNPYEQMSDEELEMLAKYRESKIQQAEVVEKPELLDKKD